MKTTELSLFTRTTFAILFIATLTGFNLHAQTSALDTPPGGAASGSAPAEGLVSNSDFSQATKDPAWPDNWPKGAGLTWEAEGGTHFLRLTAQEPGKMLMVYRDIAIPTGVTKLQITIKYRISNVINGGQKWLDARAIFHFLDADRKQVKPDPGVLDFTKGTDGWTEATETCAVPAGATTLALMPSLFKIQSGILDLGSVQVIAVP